MNGTIVQVLETVNTMILICGSFLNVNVTNCNLESQLSLLTPQILTKLMKIVKLVMVKEKKKKKKNHLIQINNHQIQINNHQIQINKDEIETRWSQYGRKGSNDFRTNVSRVSRMSNQFGLAPGEQKLVQV